MSMYMRQTQIFDPEKHNDKHAVIIGAGSEGSYMALALANLGVQNITVYDFDTVEIHNVPNQLYGPEDVGKPKVEALKEIVKRLSGIDIEIFNEKVDGNTILPAGTGIIYILALDSFEARKEILDILKLVGSWVIDPRMGGEEYSIFTLRMDDTDAVENLESTLTKEGSDLPCGMRSIIYTLWAVSSEVCNIFKRICNNQDVPQILKRSMNTYVCINSLLAKQRKEQLQSETIETIQVEID